MSVLRSRVLGVGSYLPEKLVSNVELSKTVDTSDEWIRERAGIVYRHILAEDENNSDMAFHAAQRAIAQANLDVSDIDAIVLATTSPDHFLPSTATLLQGKLGAKRGCCYDVQAACSGFIYALQQADNMIRLKQAKTVLVVGSEALTRMVDWKDRNSCVLFGDGAGAIVLQAFEGEGTLKDPGVLDTYLRSDGKLYDLLASTGGTWNQTYGLITMNHGKEVFKNAVVLMAQACVHILEKHNLTIDDVDWMVPHQANLRILESTASRLNFPREKMILTVDHTANTSAASIPIAVDEAMKGGKIKPGNLLLFVGLGAGLTWGSALVRV